MRIDQHAPGGAACPGEAACPEGGSMPRESNMPRRSSMPRVSGITGLHIAAFHEIKDKLVSVF
jgi:hypothetical protein